MPQKAPPRRTDRDQSGHAEEHECGASQESEDIRFENLRDHWIEQTPRPCIRPAPGHATCAAGRSRADEV